MRIAIPDDYQNVIPSLKCFNLLKGHQVTLVNEYVSDPRELAERLNNPEVLILTRARSPVNQQLLRYLPDLKIISQTGKNISHIDEKACKKLGIIILQGRGNPIATAELTWALIMNGLRLLPQAIAGMKEGKWQTNLGRRVYGKRIGIWGYGKIGKRIAQYAKAFGAEVCIWGSEGSRKQAVEDGFTSADSKGEFFRSCDVVSLHLRLNETTRGLITSQDLLQMKPDALLVNTARAGLIEKGELLAALKTGRPGFAAIDVFEEEPIFERDHPLLKMPNVICTPHLGYTEKESFELYFSIAFQNVVDFLAQKG